MTDRIKGQHSSDCNEILLYSTHEISDPLCTSLSSFVTCDKCVIICICKALRLRKFCTMMSWCTKSMCGDTRVMSWDVFCMLLTHVNVLLSEPQLVPLLPDVNIAWQERRLENILLVRSKSVFKYWWLPTTWHLQQEADLCSAGNVAALWKWALQSDI